MSMDGPYCSNCGSVLSPGASYCSQCGHRVGGGAAAEQPSTVNLSAPPTADSPRITEEDAKRIARAQTLEQGRNIWIGCGIFVAVFVIGWLILTLLLSL
jgi:uncharacterized membrane protein YvbJ